MFGPHRASRAHPKFSSIRLAFHLRDPDVLRMARGSQVRSEPCDGKHMGPWVKHRQPKWKLCKYKGSHFLRVEQTCAMPFQAVSKSLAIERQWSDPRNHQLVASQTIMFSCPHFHRALSSKHFASRKQKSGYNTFGRFGVPMLCFCGLHVGLHPTLCAALRQAVGTGPGGTR